MPDVEAGAEMRKAGKPTALRFLQASPIRGTLLWSGSQVS
jgi:hypothetical protein